MSEPGRDYPFAECAGRGFCSPTDTILALCATGGRGAMAVNELAKAGFTNVYNIINGFEGGRQGPGRAREAGLRRAQHAVQVRY